ncbi:MAG: M1 family aminopeptidase [Candidatus Zixiibacteriota bacterium]
MKTKSVLLRTILTSLMIVILSSFPSMAEDSRDINWDEAAPSVIHQKLAEGKARGLLDKNLSRQYLAQAEVDDNRQNYDVTLYDIYIRVNDTTEILYGVVKIVASVTEDAVSAVDVDFYSGMSIDSIVSPGGTLSYTRSGNVVTVNLDRAYDTDEIFDFDFFYHGHPTEGGLQAFSFDYYYTSPVISSLSEPYFARTWWPCKDVMWDKADSFNIAIEVDTGFYVGSNGTLDSTVTASDNSHTFYYSVRYPMVTYLFSVAISDYMVWTQDYIYNGGLDTMPVVHAVYPEQYTYSQSHWGITPYAIDIFAGVYGPYPFLEEKYGHSNFTWGGGMEHQTMTSMTGTSFGFSEPVVVHELSHQWWGDMITCESWEDIWLNEGWASYSEALYYLMTSGWSSYRSYMNGMRYTGGGTVFCDDTTDVWRIFDPYLSYDKGAWVVHMLRGVLGETTFAQAIYDYYHSEYQYGALTTEEFKNLWELSSGRELDWFFDEWIYGTYLPSYYYYSYCEPSDSGGYDYFLNIKQVQATNPQVFTMPIDIYAAYMTMGSDTLTVFNDQREQMFKFNLPDSIMYITFDPAEWILCFKTFQTWTMFVTTLNEELSAVERGVTYLDTIDVKGGSGGPFVVSVTGGDFPTGLNIDDMGIISGTTGVDTGSYTFTVSFNDTSAGYTDGAELTLYVVPGPGCCIGTVGNVNCSAEETPDISDITRLIDYLYLSHDPLCCQEEADANVSGGEPDISDITRLIDFLYLSHSNLADCPL